MRPIEPFVMPLYKCKNCGKVISEPQLQSFNISYNDLYCRGRWCLCEECIEKGITRPKSASFSKKVLGENAVAFLSELIEIISRYRVELGDVFYGEDYNGE